MRRKYEIDALPIIAIPEVLDLIFSWLNHSEILSFKLINYASYQQAMSYLLAHANERLTCDLLELAATKKMAFPLSGQSLMKAVLKPDVFIPFRTYGLYAIAASNKMDLQVENELINNITANIVNFESKNNRPYITDLRFIADLLTQEQIQLVRETLSQLSPIDDYATEDFDNWQHMKVEPKDLFPFFDSRLESFRQTLSVSHEKIRPGFNKDEINVEIISLLNQLPSDEFYNSLGLLEELAPFLTNSEIVLDLRPLIASIKYCPYRIMGLLERLWPYRDKRITL